jgi:hypothetical protein
MALFSFTKQTNVSAMKNIIAIAISICSLASFNFVSAQEGLPDNTTYKTAVGIRLSSTPALQKNSISLKHFLNETTAIEGLLSIGDPITLGALLEFHYPFSTPGLQWLYGAGGYFGTGKEYSTEKAMEIQKTYLGAQGIVGIDYKFANIPLNLSLDWKPELNLISDINFEPGAVGLTARFTFGK